MDASQRVVPLLSYRDATAALDFLSRAFGFEETFRYEDTDGRIGFAELDYRGSRIALASSYDEWGFSSPLSLAGHHSQLMLEVEDLDAHYAQARDGGALVVGAPQHEHGDERSYRAVDLEGHRWLFRSPGSQA